MGRKEQSWHLRGSSKQKQTSWWQQLHQLFILFRLEQYSTEIWMHGVNNIGRRYNLSAQMLAQRFSRSAETFDDAPLFQLCFKNSAKINLFQLKRFSMKFRLFNWMTCEFILRTQFSQLIHGIPCWLARVSLHGTFAERDIDLFWQVFQSSSGQDEATSGRPLKLYRGEQHPGTLTVVSSPRPSLGKVPGKTLWCSMVHFEPNYGNSSTKRLWFWKIN